MGGGNDCGRPGIIIAKSRNKTEANGYTEFGGVEITGDLHRTGVAAFVVDDSDGLGQSGQRSRKPKQYIFQMGLHNCLCRRWRHVACRRPSNGEWKRWNNYRIVQIFSVIVAIAVMFDLLNIRAPPAHKQNEMN